MLKNDGKKFFLIATSNAEAKKNMCEWLEVRYPDGVIYTAADYMECLVKIKNAPPHILVTDFELSKGRPGHVIDSILADKNSKVAIVAIGSTPKNQEQFDAVALGKLHFELDIPNMDVFHNVIAKVSEYGFRSDASAYVMKKINKGEILISEGDLTKQVYILKTGLLRAYKKHASGETYSIGEIKPGEFVGEMAYFNEEARNASVDALEDSELIEIQPTVFERVILQKPSWAKTVISTMTRRLRGGK
jgi:CRP/FNR family cyclic AMP-dependent transcriptional regulator